MEFSLCELSSAHHDSNQLKRQNKQFWIYISGQNDNLS